VIRPTSRPKTWIAIQSTKTSLDPQDVLDNRTSKPATEKAARRVKPKEEGKRVRTWAKRRGSRLPFGSPPEEKKKGVIWEHPTANSEGDDRR